MPSNFKQEMKSRLVTALTIAPTLAVMLLSAVYQLAAELTGFGLSVGLPLLLGVLTLLAFFASLVLGIVWEKRFTPTFFAVLFWLCFGSYLSIVISGTTDLLADSFFEAMTLVFSLPVWSYMSVVSHGGDSVAVAALVLTAVLALLNTGVAIWLFVKERRAANGG